MNEWFERHPERIPPCELDAQESARLAPVLDRLIPATGDRPSGAVVLLDRGRLGEALKVRPDLSMPLRAVVDHLRSVPSQIGVEATVDDLFTALAKEMNDLGQLIAGAYLMDPAVRQAIGYPGQEDRRLSDDTGEYLDLLEAVVDRGEFHRTTPERK